MFSLPLWGGLLGWFIAGLCAYRAYTLWRLNGVLAHRYQSCIETHDRLIKQHREWHAEEKTDPGIHFGRI